MQSVPAPPELPSIGLFAQCDCIGVAAQRHYYLAFVYSESHIVIVRPLRKVGEHGMQVIERWRKAHGVIGE
jgi:hypothetical protein